MLSQSDPVVVFRMVERLTLSAVVLVFSVVVMIGFWRSVQKLDLRQSGGLGLGGSVMFSTPVFVLLTIVGYAWVSLSHPISVTPTAAPGAGAEEGRDDGAGVAAAARAGSFVGASATGAPAERSAHAFSVAQRRIRSLNCLAADAALGPRLEDDLADVKLMLMAAVWPAEWGELDAFADWARGTSDAVPEPAAVTLFEERHVAC